MSERTATEIKCTDCGKIATVPFKPTPGKPVYCRECLPKHISKRSENTKPDGSMQKQAWSRRRTNWR